MPLTPSTVPQEGRPVARTLFSAKLTPPILRGDAVERLRLLELLLEYSPANVHIVMGTRRMPMLPLARLRMRQELLELNAQDLRFLREEAAQFLYARCGAQLGKATLDRLLETTEGWPAAL